jgi:predicted O-methyltransferase YrrM
VEHWDHVAEFLKAQGIPEPLLSFFCISRDEAAHISRIVEKLEPRSILEIGSFVGLSTGVLGLASDDACSLVVVDPNFSITIQAHRFGYQGALEPRRSFTYVQNVVEHFFPRKSVALLEGLYSGCSHRFASKYLEPMGVDACVMPIVGVEASRFAPFDLVFLDGDHFAESVYRDLSLICRDLEDAGTIILHDVAGAWQTEVLAGVGEFLTDHPEYSLVTQNNLGVIAVSPAL